MCKPFCFIAILVLAAISPYAQTVDSSANHRVNRLSLVYVPSAFVVAGIAINGNGAEGFKKEIAEERNERLPAFHTSIDNYLQYAPIGIAYGLDAMGYRSKTDIANRSVILLKGELLMTGTVFALKKITHAPRPDNSSYTSFPSGHTAQAFAAATFLNEEYGSRFKWMPYASYGMAASVGMLRIANNKHYISDVLVGAGLGILSMKLAYATHQYKWSRKQELLPVF